ERADGVRDACTVDAPERDAHTVDPDGNAECTDRIRDAHVVAGDHAADGFAARAVGATRRARGLERAGRVRTTARAAGAQLRAAERADLVPATARGHAGRARPRDAIPGDAGLDVGPRSVAVPARRADRRDPAAAAAGVREDAVRTHVDREGEGQGRQDIARTARD